MVRIAYKEVKNNSRLTDFSDLKETVILNAVKNVPQELKTRSHGQNRMLDYFY